MNIQALKAFAPTVRRQLIAAVTLQLDHALTARTPDYLDTYAPQVAALRKLEKEDRVGLIERVAYTWFNRLAALRFLDARGWHPFGVRVLTPATSDETQPELLKLMRSGSCPEELRKHTSIDRLNGLLDGRIPSNAAQGEVYRHLVLAACHFYHALLPNIFENLDDETELLLPNDLLTEQSVVQGFRTEISDEDCSEVELLGWLYQFYILEKKDQVMARKAAVPTEDIPAVTQLFTPHWIVRYLVENSLGRLWLLNHTESKLRARMLYYIEGESESDFLHVSGPEEIKICDPAVGSGHMLTYAFDLLYFIYEEEGYPASDIPALILNHNLHGLDLCPRAAQLAELALLFKARETSSRFFQQESLVRPRILELREVRFADNELRNYIQTLNVGDLFNERLVRLMHQFSEAKNVGSLIQPLLDKPTIAFIRETIQAKDLGSHLFLHETHLKVLRVLEQAEALAHQYHIILANPPYMGSGGMNPCVKNFAKDLYTSSKADLFGMFMERAELLCLPRGYFAMVTMQTWMFLSSFEDLRTALLDSSTIVTLTQIGFNSFPEMNSKIVQACAFVFKHAVQMQEGLYLNLNDAPQSANKDEVFLEKRQNGEVFHACGEDFEKIPGSPIAYWLSPKVRHAFATGHTVAGAFDVRQGVITGNNGLFLRFSWEVSRNSTALRPDELNGDKRWFPLNKGGPRRKWYGNHDYVINWEDDGRDLRNYRDSSGTLLSRPQNLQFFFKEGVTWPLITSSGFSARMMEKGFIFNVAGLTAFPRTGDTKVLLCYLNSSIVSILVGAINPTLNTNVGDVGNLPWPPETVASIRDAVQPLADELVSIGREDWNNFEISWDFYDLPLLRRSLKSETLEASWRNWEVQSAAAVRRMQELETHNNRLFIEVYGLQDELSPEVPEEQITLARADAREDMGGFLSYAVGCMMGRYSLDRPGLILVNAGESVSDYLAEVGRGRDQLTFAPDDDGIIPVLDGEWFEGDIVARTREFLRVTFGEATLKENINFIEESLGRDLRNYFLTDFYKDHLQTYKKRPIYWMIQSPRKGFSVLIYLHRYTRDTMNLVLNRYLREYQIKMRSRIANLADVQSSSAVSTRDKTAARKEFNKLTKTLHECEEWERQVVLPLAQARIKLDLNDGVKVNYLKLGEALAPIPGLADTED